MSAELCLGWCQLWQKRPGKMVEHPNQRNPTQVHEQMGQPVFLFASLEIQFIISHYHQFSNPVESYNFPPRHRFPHYAFMKLLTALRQWFAIEVSIIWCTGRILVVQFCSRPTWSCPPDSGASAPCQTDNSILSSWVCNSIDKWRAFFHYICKSTEFRPRALFHLVWSGSEINVYRVCEAQLGTTATFSVQN